jgi:hypothetical protein
VQTEIEVFFPCFLVVAEKRSFLTWRGSIVRLSSTEGRSEEGISKRT